MTLSPGGRVGSAALLVVAVATTPTGSNASLTLAALLALAVVIVTRPRLRWLARRAAIGLGAVMTIALPVVFGAGLDSAARLAARAGLALVIALAGASTLPLASLPTALGQLRVPRALASTMHAMIWQLDHVSDEARRLVLARRLRGATGFGPAVLATLLLRTRARAERVELAMQLRGATDSDGVPLARFSAHDLSAFAAAAAAAVALHGIAR